MDSECRKFYISEKIMRGNVKGREKKWERQGKYNKLINMCVTQWKCGLRGFVWKDFSVRREEYWFWKLEIRMGEIERAG